MVSPYITTGRNIQHEMLTKTAVCAPHQWTVELGDHMTPLGLFFLNLRKIIMTQVSILWIEQFELLLVTRCISYVPFPFFFFRI